MTRGRHGSAAIGWAIVGTLALAPAAVAAQSPRGAILFLQCRACHTLKAGEPNKVGPNLSRLFTRGPLAAQGFKYSPTFTAAKLGWTPATLDRWLEKPGSMVKGTTMAFGGMAKPADRSELIAWLQGATR